MTNSVELEPTPQTVHDAVCHMDFPATESAGSSTFEGKLYYFCSSDCKQRFDAHPEQVIEAEAAYHDSGAKTAS